MGKRLVSYRHTFINSVGTFFSRVLGILKWTIVNYLFGASADPFHASFKVINNLRRIVGEGAVSNAFIPVYQLKNDENREQADLFASNIINLFVIGTAILTLIGILLAPYYFPLLMSGNEAGSENLKAGVILMMIMMPFTIFISLFALAMGVLNSHKRFTTPAFAPLVFNVVFIIFPLLFHKQLGIYSLGIGVVVGGLGMFLLEIIELIGIGFKYRLHVDIKSPAIRKFFRLFMPTALNMGILMLNALISMSFISFLQEGSFTVIQNAFIINQAPIGVFGIAIGTVLLPLLSGFSVRNDQIQFRKAVGEGFYLLFYLMMPISLFFIIYPDILVNLFHRDLMLLFTGNIGEFTDVLFAQLIGATRLYGLGLMAMSLNIVLAKVFYSISDAKTPLWGSIVLTVISLGGFIVNHFTGGDFRGIIIADVVASWGVSLLYLLRLRRSVDMKALAKEILLKMLIIILISCIVIGIVYPFYRFVYTEMDNVYLSLLTGIGSLLIFSGVYYLITKIFKLELKK